ncbi:MULTISPECIES: DUF438 domain-containing protein [unclassified Jeotgalibaca]|uniref:DUF438 domain-containing protein n=1 Tax=unclassified Jeotgalibaca TaxID=2621505 RepID=UPI003FD53527
MIEDLKNKRSKDFEDRQAILKDLILRLHADENPDVIKQEFKEHFGNVSAFEISVMERRLMGEGIEAEEIMRLCNVHASLFNGSIEAVYQQGEGHDSPGHPIRVLKEENLALESTMDKIVNLLAAYLEEPDAQLKKGLLMQLDMLWEIDKHYARKENSYFPIMERYGMTAPPKVMWGVDDEIRELIKDFRTRIENDEREGLDFEPVKYEVEEMIVKEEEIMLPMIIPFFNEDDWISIADESEEIGFCIVKPEQKWIPKREKVEASIESGNIDLGLGVLTQKELKKILDLQPLELTFIDENDIVKYFNDGPERKLFPRTKNAIGREVYNCHPPKSQPIVRKLIADFKAGAKDSETLWFRARDTYVMVSYAAVRDDDGTYMGTLEWVQNIENIINIEEEKRTID